MTKIRLEQKDYEAILLWLGLSFTHSRFTWDKYHDEAVVELEKTLQECFDLAISVEES